MAGTHYHLMERDGEEWADKHAHLTWQAWNGLERLAGTTAPEDPAAVLGRTWAADTAELDRISDVMKGTTPVLAAGLSLADSRLVRLLAAALCI